MLNNLKHVAIIMDGNGRWAKARYLPRTAGHIQGVKRVKEIVKYSSKIGLKYLTLFAFGRENWARPKQEVSFLMKLLSQKLTSEFSQLVKENVKLRFIGDKTRLNSEILDKINHLESASVNNDGLNLNIALDYSGSYDIIQAVNQISNKGINVDEEEFSKYLLTYPTPNPELLIRTSGESRISNFMLWQAMYSELYFTQVMWPEFDVAEFEKAIQWYHTRERRFGMTSEQINQEA